MRTVVRVAALAGVRGRRLVALIALGAVSSLLAVLPVQFLAVAVDVVADDPGGGGIGTWLRTVVGEIAPTGRVDTAVTAVACFLVASLIAEGVRITFGYAAMRTTNSIVVRIKQQLFDRTLAVPATAIRGRSRGDMIHRVSSDPAQLESLYGIPLTTIGSDLLDVFWVVVIVAALRWDLALILVLPMPLIVVLGVRAAREQRRTAEQLREADGAMTTAAEQTASNLMVIKSFGGERRESTLFGALTARALEARQRGNARLASFFVKTSLVRLTATGGLLCYAIYLVASGQLAIGAIAILVSYTARFYSPMLNLSKSWQAIQRGLVAGERVLELFDRSSEPWADRSDHAGRVEPQLPGSLALRNLSVTVAADRTLSYPDTAVPAGGLAVVTGPSGSGKSTLLHSLMGFVVPATGSITVGDGDLATLDGHTRRDLFAYAGQENFLHDVSVLDNATYPTDVSESPTALESLGRLELGDRAHDLVGEAGARLSGGQARRLVLARALSRPAPILLLDEVFANLDPASAELVAESIIDVLGKRTVILVGHEVPDQLKPHVSVEIRIGSAPTTVLVPRS